jgi:hypothetical protein
MGTSVELGARVAQGTSAEPTASAARWLSLTGAAAAVLVVVSFAGLGGDTPGAEDPAAKISSYYGSHQAREMIAAFVLAASAPFFVVFGIWLAATLHPAAGARSIWQTLLTVGSGVAGAGFMIAALIHVALVQTANYDGIAGGALQALAGLDENSWVAFNAGLGVMMLGVGASVLASKAHRVLGWIALLAGIALFIPFADFVALIVTGLWLIWTSIAMYRRGPAFATAA